MAPYEPLSPGEPVHEGEAGNVPEHAVSPERASGEEALEALRRTEEDPPGEGHERTGDGIEGTSTEDVGPHRPTRELRQQYPREYIEPVDPPTPRTPFDDPRTWVNEVNPRFREGMPFRVNCVDCTRSGENTWRGRAESAAGRAQEVGETTTRTEDWYGRRFEAVDGNEVVDRLGRGGAGSSAFMVVRYEALDTSMPVPLRREGAHAFNIVNHEGDILLVDGQTGQVEPFDGGWPPSGWNPTTKATSMEMIGFNRHGGVL